MNIGIFTNNYLPNPYGVSNSIETFRLEFEKMGHEVFIFAPKFKEYEDENPRVFRYPTIDVKVKFRFPLAIPYSWKINRIIKNLDLDVIHSQHPNLLGAVGMKWAKKKKIPLIFTWHTLYDKYVHFAPFIPKKLAAYLTIKQAVGYANKASAVVAPTDSILPIIRGWGVVNKNLFVVPTGVRKEEFENVDGKNIRRKYNIAEDELVLVCISRLTLEKNVEFLFRATVSILRENEKVKFLIVGDGDLRSKLEEYVKNEKVEDKVIFTGEVRPEERKNYYAAGDIFIYASKSETQGMIITEAMHMNLPIVAVAASGINSLVLNNGNGFLVKEDEDEFGKAVQKLITDKDLRNKFGAVSKTIVEKNFTSLISAEKMLEVYNNATLRMKNETSR